MPIFADIGETRITRKHIWTAATLQRSLCIGSYGNECLHENAFLMIQIVSISCILIIIIFMYNAGRMDLLAEIVVAKEKENSSMLVTCKKKTKSYFSKLSTFTICSS